MISTAFRASTGRLALCFATLLLATPAVAGTARANHFDVHVVRDSGDKIVLDYSVTGYQTRAAGVIAGAPRVELMLDREARMEHQVGNPAVPILARSLVIPGDAAMTAKVVDSHYYEVKNVDLAPSKGNLLRNVDPADVPFEFGAVYQKDAFYPGKLVDTGKPYILRDQRGLVVTAFPFQYNPVTRTLRVYDRMRVEVSRTGPAKINPMAATRRLHPSASFSRFYSRHFLNAPAPTRGEMEEGGMLIIAYDDWLPNVQPLVDHKNSIGIPTTAVGVSEIGNDSASIKAYIQNAYDSGDLSFVLLVGDAAQVATLTSGSGWSSASSDPSYSKLAGNDDYPDIYVGRFSAETAADVDTQVERTVDYETMPATTQDWFKKGIGLASSEGPGDNNEYDYEHIGNIRDRLLDYGYTSIDEIYDPGARSSDITAAIDEGRGIINYCGHGDVTMWASAGTFTNSNVNNLDNAGTLPFIVSVACLVGVFDGNTCFAESWLRATNDAGEPTGAVAFWGASISQAWNPPMYAQDAVDDTLISESNFTVGGILFGGAAKMMDAYGSDGVTEFNAWHIFGDPSLRIFGIPVPPTGMYIKQSAVLSATGDAGGPFTPASITYTLENRGEQPLDYTVAADESWISVSPASGTLASGATVDVEVSIGSDANPLTNGDYTGTVTFTNTTDHEGDTTRDVALSVGIPDLQHEWPLDQDPGWTVEGQWGFGTPTGAGGASGQSAGGSKDPTSGHTGSNVYGYNLSGNYGNNLGEESLTSEAIDCSGLTRVSIKFWRWLGVEQGIYDHASVRVSTDGANWTTVWENTGEVADSDWTQQEVDISEIADGQPTVYVRWTMGTTDESYVFCGWNIDDIELWGLGSLDCADTDGDGFSDVACGGEDCDDTDYDVRPNAVEICDDQIDNNCDEAIDDQDVACGGGGNTDGGIDNGDGGGTGANGGSGADCGCRVGGEPATGDLAGGLLLLGLGLILVRRRRRD